MKQDRNQGNLFLNVNVPGIGSEKEEPYLLNRFANFSKISVFNNHARTKYKLDMTSRTKNQGCQFLLKKIERIC